MERRPKPSFFGHVAIQGRNGSKYCPLLSCGSQQIKLVVIKSGNVGGGE